MSDNNSLSKSYNASEVEGRWRDVWSQKNLFTPIASDSLPKKSPKKKPYVIMMPPPNVTGALHNGHALFVTLEDILARYHRMKGENVLWLPGTDHAGIATQTVVERELWNKEKKTKHDLGREKFIDRVWQWKEKHGSQIVEQLKLLGASADWSRQRFTMDPECVHSVNSAFVKMWEDGLIYRSERLVNWDPVSQTALSNEEVDHVPRKGELWKFAYKLKGQEDEEIIVATTRPETMLGDTAVAVHPEDKRHKHLIGKQLVHPFFSDRVLPVIGDFGVEQEFGTGAVKITPAHDPNDFEMGRRHQLATISVLNKDGSINRNGGPYEGLDRFAARDLVKKDLSSLGLFRGSEEIEHAVSVSQRSHADIEPMLSRQYFVKTQSLAQAANDAVKNGDVRIIPQHFNKTWANFLDNIQDWCISRQLWWGHQIPVYYDLEKMRDAIRQDAQEKGFATESVRALDAQSPVEQVLRIALDELDDKLVRSFSCASTEPPADFFANRYIQEEDVLDTWFSSGLWPFSALGWPNKTDDLEAFFPGSVLETGSDILFFWVARMMMLGIYFMGEAPFKDVFLHSMVRDAHGQKMSKSLGNAIDPIDVVRGISLEDIQTKIRSFPVPSHLLEKVLAGLGKDYPDGIPESGADGLRLSLAILSGQGQDVRLAIPRIAGYRAFLNKIWNATRFVLMNTDENAGSESYSRQELSLCDRWILSRLQKTNLKVEECLDSYRFGEAAELIYHFFWSDVCDWYIEFIKPALTSGASSTQRQQSQSVLLEVLDVSMRLFHPFCPFITEEIWQILPGVKKWHEKGVEFCAVAPFPQTQSDLIDEDAEHTVELIQQTVVMIRNVRQQSGLPPRKKVSVVVAAEKTIRELLHGNQDMLSQLACLEDITFVERGSYEAPSSAATSLGDSVDVALLLEDLIDPVAEKERSEKELEKVLKEILSLRSRLENEDFVAKAPAAIVEKQRAQLETLLEKRDRLNGILSRLQ